MKIFFIMKQYPNLFKISGNCSMKNIIFYKFSGSGNDFIIIDNRQNVVTHPSLPRFVMNLCTRKMSAGADGLILIENSQNADFKWRFYNSDGSLAEMCGNGARCAARFAFLNKIAGKMMSFETAAGIVSAEIIDEMVKIKLTDPVDFIPDFVLELSSGHTRLGKINTGVPHVVIKTDNLDNINLPKLGKEIRFHDLFAPAGTNVNFASIKNKNTIEIRTYERGVENETLACGTGSVASAIIIAHNRGIKPPLKVITRSGCILTIHFKEKGEKFHDVYLEGDARIIYKGELFEDAWNYEPQGLAQR